LSWTSLACWETCVRNFLPYSPDIFPIRLPGLVNSPCPGPSHVYARNPLNFLPGSDIPLSCRRRVGVRLPPSMGRWCLSFAVQLPASCSPSSTGPCAGRLAFPSNCPGLTVAGPSLACWRLCSSLVAFRLRALLVLLGGPWPCRRAASLGSRFPLWVVLLAPNSPGASFSFEAGGLPGTVPFLFLLSTASRVSGALPDWLVHRERFLGNAAREGSLGTTGAGTTRSARTELPSFLTKSDIGHLPSRTGSKISAGDPCWCRSETEAETMAALTFLFLNAWGKLIPTVLLSCLSWIPPTCGHRRAQCHITAQSCRLLSVRAFQRALPLKLWRTAPLP
jgi:hypothetical protein